VERPPPNLLEACGPSPSRGSSLATPMGVPATDGDGLTQYILFFFSPLCHFCPPSIASNPKRMSGVRSQRCERCEVPVLCGEAVEEGCREPRVAVGLAGRKPEGGLGGGEPPFNDGIWMTRVLRWLGPK